MAKKHIDRAALIATIRELKELSNEQKSDILQLISEQKKYGIVWEDSPEDVEENLRANVPVLVEDKDKAIISNADDAPNHILIEGDNLEALTALSYTHEGKIDVIYIDPPYNTGNKDFVYNDSFVDSEDGYRHSKWLSFMEKRLKIAKKLLSDKGVIFISIGDDEECNLQLLCKEVFGEKNYIETYIWESTLRPDNSSPILRRNAEFVLCCAKNKANILRFRNVPTATSGMASLTKAKEKRQVLCFPSNYVRTTLPDGIYKAGLKENGGNLQWELKADAIVKDGIFISDVILEGNSYWHTKKKIQQEQNAGTEIWIKSESFVPYYQKNTDSGNRPTKILPSSIVNDGIYGNTELNNIFNEKVFNNPKPSTLISLLVNCTDNSNSVVLDFFAGSGTTLHATMQLNAEDGGHRQCILCTNNENNICEEVTYERNKRVINGYTTPKGVEVEGLHDNSLRYYKIEDVPRDSSTTGLKKLMLASTDLLCIKNDLYEEKSLFGNIKLRKHIARYFDDDKQKMLIIYKVEAIESIVEEIKKMPDDTFIKVYVFSTNNYAMDADFEEVSDKVFLCALPAAIYNAYRKVLPRKNNVITEEEEV